ncbi:IclR family transcriptional regulator [Propionicicella superfundia]|uniref:IclR family transcriptional regulator n=1 Tax=Propionicicella superfundia TaxID=348582 RepID=UPI0004093BAC|nr:IclR family transcriptional regulator [Propionicicella superfundia]
MSRPVPAASAALRVLRYLSERAAPVPAGRIARDLGLPRSTAYHLLAAMAAESFVVHYPEEHAWGVGIAAWEVGQGYTRQAPLARLARLPLTRLVDRVGQSAHLSVLHGSDVVYIHEERAPGRPPLVTDVGVRLPAHLAASGRAILAGLPRQQVRALYPSAAAFTDRTGAGPRTSAALRRVLAETRARGYATEDSEITPGFASVAVAIRSPANLASLAVTWPVASDVDPAGVVAALRATAATIEDRLR